MLHLNTNQNKTLKMKRITKTTLTLAAAAFLAATSQAEVINIDFNTNIAGAPTLAPYAGASANGPIASGSVWNQFTLSSPPDGQSMNNLLDDSGTETAVAVAFGTGWAGSYNNGVPNNLQADRAYTSGGGTGTFTVSGLTPGGTYNLALFVDDNDTGSIATDFTIGATTMMAFGGSAGTDVDGPLTFTAGETHALFSGISASVDGDITISVTAAAGAIFGSFPGLQIEGSFIPFTDTDPTLIGTDPADDATVGVAAGQNLVMTFDKTVQAGTSGTIALWKTSPDTLVESFDVTSPTGLTFGGTSVTINPSADLVAGVEYYVLIDADAIVDTSSNGFAGITVIGDWSFSPDGTPPAVGTIDSPANEATSVRVNGNLSLTFDEDVQKGSGSIVIRRFDDDSEVDTIDVASVSVTITGGLVTFAPTADLPAGTQLYVEIGAGAFQDVAGNAFGGITGSAAWSFTTSASQAAVINIDFNTDIAGAPTLAPYAGASANGPIASGSVWNQFTLSSPPDGQSMNNLLDDSGTETAVAVAFGTGWAGSYNNGVPNNLQADRAYTSGGGTGTFTVSGLTPGGTYNLALFVDDNDTGSIATDFTIGATTMMAFGGSAGTDVDGPLTFTAGETHALFSGISASVDGDITISTTQAAGATFGSFPGLQIEGSFGPDDLAPPLITSISIVPSGIDAIVSFTWNSRPAVTYLVERSDDLETWFELDDSKASGGATTTFEENIAGDTVPKRFYRVTEN